MEIPQIVGVAIFLFVLGCCIGSFLNVVIWRLPYRGEKVSFGGKTAALTLSWPPSHCPKCDSPVKWYQNIPIFSWLFLRGRCANCKTPISVRYPLVEAGTGMIFVALFLALFASHWVPGFEGKIDDDIPATATLFVYLVMASILLAASAIDADWYQIPLSLTAWLTAIGLIAAPLIPHVAMPDLAKLGGSPEGYRTLAMGTIGGVVGLLLANFLLWRKMIPRSFGEEYEAQWKAAEEKMPKPEEKNQQQAVSPPPNLTRRKALVACVLVVIAAAVGIWFMGNVKVAGVVTVAAGIAIFLLGVLPRDAETVDVTQEVMDEISGPGVRKEALKEVLFLAIPILFAIAAMSIPVNVPDAGWLSRLLGAMFGGLVGGGIVWLVRICGTLGFNKEAMGLGDAHLMAAIGTVIGGPLVIVAFLFIAPVLGLMWALVLKVMKKQSVLPYGPWLAIGSLFSLLCGMDILRALGLF